MKNLTCQVCKEREAYKKISSSIDGSFFLVCKKKKCIKKMYESIKSGEPIQEFVAKVKWDRNEHQGRTYQQVKSSYDIMDVVIKIALSALIFGSLYVFLKSIL